MRTVIAFAIALVPATAQASPLSDVADALEPGEWGELQTEEIDAVLQAGGASGIDFGYAEDIVWDPTSGRLFYMGGDHDDIANFITYSEATNTWETLPRPSWVGSNTMHAYDHSAIDVERQFFYHRPFGNNTVHRYDIVGDTWSELPGAPDNGVSCCDALAFFPEMDSLIWAHHSYGELLGFSEDTQAWTLFDQRPAGQTWNVAEYNPVHGFVVFAHSDQVYRLDADGTVTDLGALGVNIYDGSGFTGVLTVDPVSGDHIVSSVAAGGRTFHVFDAVENAWAELPTQPETDLADTAMVGTPVSTYGAIVFPYCFGGTPCGVLVYRHSPFDIPPSETTGSDGETDGESDTEGASGETQSGGTDDPPMTTTSNAPQSTTDASTAGSASPTATGPGENDGGSAGTQGCGCRGFGGGTGPGALAVLALFFAVRRRR